MRGEPKPDQGGEKKQVGESSGGEIGEVGLGMKRT